MGNSRAQSEIRFHEYQARGAGAELSLRSIFLILLSMVGSVYLFRIHVLALIPVAFLQWKILLRIQRGSARGVLWLGILFPLVLLVLPLTYWVSLVLAQISPSLLFWFQAPAFTGSNKLGSIGFSYSALRLSMAATLARTGASLGVGEFMTYAIFPPLQMVGPISSYTLFSESFTRPKVFDVFETTARIAMGLTKFFFFSNLVNQLGFENLFNDNHPHSYGDVFIACVCYFLHLYFNFSGACDVVIALSNLLGIEIEENFDRPFLARNIKEFWNRWHRTLSNYMKEVVFTPLCTRLAHYVGIQAAIIASLLAVFVLIGVWHGGTSHYLIFGVLHGMGVITHHLYSLGLKRKLSVAQWKFYNQSRVVEALGVALTFSYVAFTFLFFANDGVELQRIFSMVR